MGEVFASFAKAMGAGIMMVFAVLVLLFGSFLQPITILFSLPLSIGGAIVALAITGQPISLPVVIGILMLMGIVTKNAIMLVDFAIEEMGRGIAAHRGHRRCRPEARAAHHHDHHRHDRRHAALGLAELGRRVPRADGDRGDRRADLLDAAVAGVRARGVHRDGRRRQARLARVLPLRRPHGGGERHATSGRWRIACRHRLNNEPFPENSNLGGGRTSASAGASKRRNDTPIFQYILIPIVRLHLPLSFLGMQIAEASPMIAIESFSTAPAPTLRLNVNPSRQSRWNGGLAAQAVVLGEKAARAPDLVDHASKGQYRR